MSNRYCWLVGGGHKKKAQYLPKDKPKTQIPFLLSGRKDTLVTPRSR